MKYNMIKSNHQLAKEYDLKSKLLGDNNLEYKLINNDRVVLLNIRDKKSTGKLVIPPFITDFQIHYEFIGSMSFVTSPFSYCRYTNIIILNSPNIKINTNWLFAKMHSKILKVESMEGMFEGYNNLMVKKLKQAIFIQIRDESKKKESWLIKLKK